MADFLALFETVDVNGEGWIAKPTLGKILDIPVRSASANVTSPSSSTKEKSLTAIQLEATPVPSRVMSVAGRQAANPEWLLTETDLEEMWDDAANLNCLSEDKSKLNYQKYLAFLVLSQESASQSKHISSASPPQYSED